LVAGRNVFELWNANGRKLPIKVKRGSWHPTTYFIVTEVRVKWDYFEKTGKLYGDAYGSTFLRGVQTEKDSKLQGSGSYQWELVL
jgi:hypothetical protein